MPPIDTSTELQSLADAVANDPGLPANIVQSDIDGGVAAAMVMNDVLMAAITATGVNADRRITPTELAEVSAYIRADADLYAAFVEGHGDDEGNLETGFHLVQGDGGALRFQNRAFVDTVADAIYHVGFKIVAGRFQNEDGNQNEQVADVAGWLNYFLNGENVVFGSDASETLHSGHYSFVFGDAHTELFLAGGGHDFIWAGQGNDEIHGGSGNDVSSGDEGHDKMFGGSGNDKFWGEEGSDNIRGGTGSDTLGGGVGNDFLRGDDGNDKLYGGEGRDTLKGGRDVDEMWGHEGTDMMFGGSGNDNLFGGDEVDKLYGGRGSDKMWGDEGDDLLSGWTGRDQISGGDGNDVLRGGAGNDTITGGDGTDYILGGTGKDLLQDWEDIEAKDIFYFAVGDTGLGNKADEIAGFDSGIDKIKLLGFGALDFVGEAAFSGSGGEVRVSNNWVHIDQNGDGTADAEISVFWVGTLSEGDFLL